MEAIALFSGLLGLFIGVAVGALLLRVAAGIAIKKDVAFGQAYGIQFLVLIANGLICGGGLAVLAQSHGPMFPLQVALTLMGLGLAAFSVQSAIYAAAFHAGFRRSCLVTTVQFLIVVGVTVFVCAFLKLGGVKHLW